MANCPEGANIEPYNGDPFGKKHFNFFTKSIQGGLLKVPVYNKRKLMPDISSGRIDTAINTARELSSTREAQLLTKKLRRIQRKKNS